MKKELLIYGLGAVLLKFISFLLMVVYASRFSTADYGVLAFLQIFVTILEWFFGLQIFSGMWRYYYELDGDNQTKLVKSSFGFSIIINFAILILAIIVIQLPIIKNIDYNYLLIIVLVASFVDYFVNQGVSILRLQRKAAAFLKLNISRSILYFILVILFVVVFRQGIVGIFYGQLIAAIFLFVIFFFFMGNSKYFSFSYDKELTKKMLAFSIPLIPASLAMWVLNSSDIFFIKYFYTMSDVGTYAFSYKIVMVVQVLLVIPINQGWIPFIFSRIKDPDFIKKKINQTLQLFFAAGFILVIFLSFFTKDILSLFAKEGYLEGTRIIFVAGLSYIMYGGCNLMDVGYHIAEKTRLLPKYFTYGAITNIILNYFFIKWFGLVGAAIATFLSFFLIFLLYNLNINKYFPLKISYKVIISIFSVGFIVYFLSLLINKLFINYIAIFFKIFLLFLYTWLLYIILRRSGALTESFREIYIKIKNILIIGENFYKLSNPVKINNFRGIDNKYVIKIVSNKDAGLLKEYSDKNRSKGHFERNIKPRLKDQKKYIGIAVIDKLKNKLAYLCWISFDNEIDTGIHYRFKLKNNEAHFFDDDCVPEYRRQGLHQRLMQERINYCINKGIKNIYIALYRNNLKKFDFKIYKRIFLIKPFKRLITF
jgi:O-antigen/teichoic acid export membrane protein/GNAT superfamily N-acetyltransferase